MVLQIAFVSAVLCLAAPPATRVAVLVDDPGQGTPALAALESTLQGLGYEVVAADTAERMRKVVAPKALLGSRLPEGLSVFEADAVLAGTVAYGTPMDVEGVKSVGITMTIRLIDLGTGRALATLHASGQGVGAGGPALFTRGASQAVRLLFNKHGLKKALSKVGQRSGTVTLIVQGLPNRDAFVALQADLGKALAGAPVKELYFARGLGKLMLGGSKSDTSMAGPDIANLVNDNRKLALAVDEVANTRIVTRYDRARTVNVKALVLEPRMPNRTRTQSKELGRYMATQLATFKFARAAFQPGRLSRKAALQRAKSAGYDVLVESEILGAGDSAALTIRIIDVASGRPIHRQQQVLSGDQKTFGAAQILVAALETALPEKIAASVTPAGVGAATASPAKMRAAGGGN